MIGELFVWIRLLWQDGLDPDKNGGLARLLLARIRYANERQVCSAKTIA